MDYWPQWLSDMALQHGAVIVSPNYRLLPEATTPEIYEDIGDFWAWVRSAIMTDLLATHTTPTELDLSRILTAGESAGGLLSISLALAHPHEIRAATAAYPMIDLGANDFSTPREHAPMGLHTPEHIYKDALAKLELGTPESSITSFARVGFMLAAIEHGHLGGLYHRGTEEPLRRKLWYPLERLEQPDISIPPGGIAILHGRQDSVVPLHSIQKFVDRARQVTNGFPGRDGLILTVRDGDHGFDGDARFEDEWLQDALQIAVQTWLE